MINLCFIIPTEMIFTDFRLFSKQWLLTTLLTLLLLLEIAPSLLCYIY